MFRRSWIRSCCVVVPTLTGCASTGAPQVAMDFSSSRFLRTPFPGDAYLARSSPLSGYPIGARRCQVTQMLDLAGTAVRSGFPLTGAIYFRIPSDTHMTLGSRVRGAPPADTITRDFPMLLVNVTPGASPSMVPIDPALIDDRGLLAMQPVQGFPLQPRARYVALVRRGATSPSLDPAPEMTDLVAGKIPDGMTPIVHAEYAASITALRGAGVSLDDVAAMTVFTTEPSPIEQMKEARAHILHDFKQDPMITPLAPFNEDGTNYCSFAGTIRMPVYQVGNLPYDKGGGNWNLDDAGHLGAPTSRVDARVVVTVPRGPMPPRGFPIVVFVRAGAGGGGDPIIDRGPGSLCPGRGRATNGPAMEFAAANFAGISVDGPFTGQRQKAYSPILTNEDTDIFNILNMVAIRDNIRQSALEVVLTANILERLALDGSGCKDLDTGGQPVRFDIDEVALFSHSMGSSISPLALAVEPRFKAAILSGAGGSFVENVMYKDMPTALAPIFEPFVATRARPFPAQDPVVNLFQWALEPADGTVYAPAMRTLQVLQIQGIVDHYIMPPIARALSVPLGLDLAGPEWDDSPKYASSYAGLTPLDAFLPLAGLKSLPLPISGAEGGRTAIVFQAEHINHIECASVGDGHEVIFEEPTPRYLYRCFLESIASGARPATVPGLDSVPADPTAPGVCAPSPATRLP